MLINKHYYHKTSKYTNQCGKLAVRPIDNVYVISRWSCQIFKMLYIMYSEVYVK